MHLGLGPLPCLMESGDRGQTGDWVHYCGHMPPLSIVSTLSSLSIVSTLSILATSYQAELHGDTETTSTRPPWPAPCNARRRVAETPRKLQQNNQYRNGYCISFFYASSCPMLVRHQPMYFKEDMFIKGNVPKASLYRLPKPRMLLHYHIAQHILCFVRIKQCINAS